MSFQAAVSKLQSPVKDLVLAATKQGTQDIGKTDQDKAEIEEWIGKVAQGDIVKESGLKVGQSSLSLLMILRPSGICRT